MVPENNLTTSPLRGRGRPRTDSTRVVLRLPPAELAALDAWIAAQPEPMSRQEAIRRAVARLTAPAARRPRASDRPLARAGDQVAASTASAAASSSCVTSPGEGRSIQSISQSR